MKRIKQFIAASCTILLLTACASGKKQMGKVMDSVYIGMPQAEFIRIVKKKELVTMQQNITIYKASKGNWYDSDGSGRDYRFFYFTDNKLTQVDKGERAVDYRIRVD